MNVWKEQPEVKEYCYGRRVSRRKYVQLLRWKIIDSCVLIFLLRFKHFNSSGAPERNTISWWWVHNEHGAPARVCCSFNNIAQGRSKMKKIQDFQGEVNLWLSHIARGSIGVFPTVCSLSTCKSIYVTEKHVIPTYTFFGAVVDQKWTISTKSSVWSSFPKYSFQFELK